MSEILLSTHAGGALRIYQLMTADGRHLLAVVGGLQGVRVLRRLSQARLLVAEEIRAGRARRRCA